MKYKLLIDAFGGKAGDVIHLSDSQIETIGKENVLDVEQKKVDNKVLTSEDISIKEDGKKTKKK